MAMRVGELVFYLTLDDKNYTHGMSTAEKTANKVAAAGKTAGNTLATGLTAAAAGATALVAAMTKTGAQYNVLQQNSRAALKTILGSQEAVNAQMEKLNDLAAKSPFSKSVFITAQQQLLAFGMATEKVIPTLDALQNAVAATGGSSQQLGDLTFVLAQIQAAGKITAQDLLQLGQRGIDAATIIGSVMGKTGAQIRQDITSGALAAGDALDALTQGLTVKFGGATDLIKQQWTGAVDRIKAAWRDTGSIIAEPFIDPNGGGQAVVWANLVADVMRQVQKHVDTTVSILNGRAQPAFAAITRGLQDAAATVAKFNMQAVFTQFDRLAKYTPLINAASTALLTMGAKNLPIVGRLASAINPLTAGLVALAATSPKLREAGSAFLDATAPAIPYLQQAAASAADLAMSLIDAVAPGLKQAADGAGKFLTSVAPIVPAVVDAAQAAVPLVRVAADMVGTIGKLPTPMLAAAAAVVAFHTPLQAIKGAIMGVAGVLPNVAAGIKLFIEQARKTGVVDAAAQSLSGFKNLLASMVTPAGLVGVGLTALTGIVAAYAAKKAEARRHAQEFSDTLDHETGALNENSRAWVVKRLEEEGALEAAQKAGLSLQELTDAVLQGGAAYDTYAQKLNQAAGEHTRMIDTGQGVRATYTEQGEALNDVHAAMGRVNKEMESGREIAMREAEAHGKEADAVDRHRNAIDALTDAKQKQAAANGDLIAAQYQTKDATEALTEQIQAMSGVERDAYGNIVLVSDANEGFVKAAKAKADAINREMDAWVKTGKTQEEVNRRQQELTQGLYDQLAALGIVGDEAAAFAQQVGLIPEHKATAVDMTVNSEAAMQSIDALMRDVATREGQITILADNTPATQTLMDALGLVQTSEGTYTINANDDPAIATLLTSLGVVDTSKGTITIDGNKQKVIDAANDAVNSINKKEGVVTIHGKDYAVSAAQKAVNTINSMWATVGIYGKKMMGMTAQADGGVVDYFAGGGFSENHVAQIAPAGAWRVWAEPETGGEAYVPLAAAKRDRSTQIMAEIARRFGDVYIPKGAQGYAAGGVNTSDTLAPSTSHTVVNFGGVRIDAASLEAIRTVEDLIRRLGYTDLMIGA